MRKMDVMIAEIETHAKLISTMCDKYFVQRLELFGSAATNQFDPAKSDFDFLVHFKPMPMTMRADTYFGLLFSLEDLFQRHIDLIEPDAIRNPYFQQSIQEKPRQLIYETRNQETFI